MRPLPTLMDYGNELQSDKCISIEDSSLGRIFLMRLNKRVFLGEVGKGEKHLHPPFLIFFFFFESFNNAERRTVEASNLKHPKIKFMIVRSHPWVGVYHLR